MMLLKCFLICFSTVFAQELEKQSFRIIAPQIICPKDKDVLSEKPDTTTVMVQARGGRQLHLAWTVRWMPLHKPSQRFTLLLWRSVRNLEEFLNHEQPEPFLYVIDNKELLPDVEYIFNVTGIMNDEMIGRKSFRINNVSGKSKLELNDGQADKFSLMLLGGDVTYSNVEYVLEAHVTMCRPTQDYHFSWLIEDFKSGTEVKTSAIGTRLLIPPGTLVAGSMYDITCEVLRSSDNLFINQMQYSVHVLRRGLEVALSSDYLVVSTGVTFNILAEVFNHDYIPDDFHLEWWCTFEGESCEAFENVDSSVLELWGGLLDFGIYEIGVTVTADSDTAKNKMTVEAVDPRLPVLEVSPVPRIVNEGSRITIIGNASYITPSCSLAWYFTPKEELDKDINVTCEECQHGELLTDIMTIYSIEENFLNELADFSNDTEWRQISAEMEAKAGRARFLAKCGCSLTFSCDTAGVVYADLFLELNHSPLVGEITVSPSSGIALDTVFSIRTPSVQDYEPPLRYSFYAKIDVNLSLLLDSYLEYVAVDTYLPYIDGVTEVWVQVCDYMGACADSLPISISVESKTVNIDVLLDSAKAHLRRCELMALTRLTTSAIVSLKNSGLSEELSAFNSRLTQLLANGAPCHSENSEQYAEFLEVIAAAGFDITQLE